MKALEILKEIQNTSVSEYFFNKDVEEAIAELEELQNRSCEECVHHLSANGNYPLTCLDCSRFYEDKYKKKDK